MLRATVEDKDDVFIENLNTALFLLLGILAVAASVILLGYAVFMAVARQQFPDGLLATSGFASLLLVTGLGSVHLFRRRRQIKKKRADSIF